MTITTILLASALIAIFSIIFKLLCLKLYLSNFKITYKLVTILYIIDWLLIIVLFYLY